jgi:phosphate transport system protein
MTAELDSQLTDLRRVLMSMAAAVEERVEIAFQAGSSGDQNLAKSLVHGDRPIDEMELQIDEAAMRILALHAPVATDLRVVVATLRISQDLERMADLAKTIGKRIVDAGEQPHVSVPPFLEQMASAATTMLKDTMQALADMDAELAMEVRKADEFVDERNREAFLWAVAELPSHGDDARAIIDVHTVARSIERIADLCTHICEDIVFAVGGVVVRHTKAD